MNQSILTSVNTFQSPLTLNKKIKGLQQHNKELQQNIKERIQSLIIQISLPNIICTTHQSPLNTPLIDTINHGHAEMHMLTSNQLIQNQIGIQQESQAREIIRNYQKRISDLRTSLVNKEAEIVYEIVQLRRDNIPKRENMQILNHQQLEKQSIKKCLQDLKKIKVQVQALEHAINKKSETKINDPIQSEQSNSINNKAQLQRLGNIPLKKSNSGAQRDKLLSKVNALLQNELIKQAKFQEEIKLSKMEWQRVTQQHRRLCNKYKLLQKQKVKINNTDRILEELQKQEIEESQMKTLFNLKDLNILKSNKKSEKQRVNLKQRRKQAKQN